MGAHLVFLDESGFLLTPSVRKTWAPVGKTPIMRCFDRHDRVSVISGISVSPKRRRLGLYYDLHTNNIRHPQVCTFVRHLLRHLRGKVFILWDRSTIHRGDPIKALCRRHRRLRLVPFPSYAPQLNPDEGVWNLAKNQLANGRPRDTYDLIRDLIHTLDRTGRSQSLLRGCITQSDLPPFLP